MANVNEQLRDAAIGHAIDLVQYSTGVMRRMLALLNRIDPDLWLQLAAALERLPVEAFTVERLDALLVGVRQLNAQVYADLERELTSELRQFTSYEADYQVGVLQATVPRPVQLFTAITPVNVDQVYAAALSRPFQGVLLKEALADLGQNRAKLLRDQLRIGYVEQEPVAKIVQRIRGTRVNGYADGFWEAPRRHVEAVVRTAVSHVAASTREALYEANADLVKAQQWLSTIDARTSSPCRLRDHLQYTNEEKPKPIGHSYPWGAGPGKFHWNCRSCSTPVLASWRDLGIDKDELDAPTRASMDGQISGETTYLDWLKRQSAARQDEVLGATRGQLLRKGGLAPDKMYDQRGRWLTLDELRERDAKAFKRAGL